MIKVEVKNLLGKATGELKLNEEVFGLEASQELIHQVMVARQANQRLSTAHTKNRSERRGANSKPWKQKGTGRARTGSVRNPIWRKGGVIFGPRSEKNYKQKVNKKMNQQAIKMVLSEKVRANNFLVVEDFNLKEAKTKEMATAVDKLAIKGKALFVMMKEDDKAVRALRNLPRTESRIADGINILDLLNNQSVVISKAAVEFLENKYAKEQVAAK